jgi:hypothetical protein
MDASVGGIKHDDGDKRVWSLLPFAATEEVLKVLEYGAAKYSTANWTKGMDWTRPLNAAMRHETAWLRGEDNDPESGINHLAHAVASLMFALTFQLKARGRDDRADYTGGL